MKEVLFQIQADILREMSGESGAGFGSRTYTASLEHEELGRVFIFEVVDVQNSSVYQRVYGAGMERLSPENETKVLETWNQLGEGMSSKMLVIEFTAMDIGNRTVNVVFLLPEEMVEEFKNEFYPVPPGGSMNDWFEKYGMWIQEAWIHGERGERVYVYGLNEILRE